MLKSLANPSNNFRSLRKELMSQKEVLAPYLTLVGKDVFWIAQGANESQNIHEVESRTKLLARSIPRPARRIPEPCESCRNGEKCKILEALTTFSISSDDGKQIFTLSFYRKFFELERFTTAIKFFAVQNGRNPAISSAFLQLPISRESLATRSMSPKIELIRGTPARL